METIETCGRVYKTIVAREMDRAIAVVWGDTAIVLDRGSRAANREAAIAAVIYVRASERHWGAALLAAVLVMLL